MGETSGRLLDLPKVNDSFGEGESRRNRDRHTPKDNEICQGNFQKSGKVKEKKRKGEKEIEGLFHFK